MDYELLSCLLCNQAISSGSNKSRDVQDCPWPTRPADTFTEVSHLANGCYYNGRVYSRPTVCPDTEIDRENPIL